MKALKQLTPKSLTPKLFGGGNKSNNNLLDAGSNRPTRPKKFSLTPKRERYGELGESETNDSERRRYEEEATSIEAVVDFLMDDDVKWAELAANDLWDRSTREESRMEIAENGGIENLVEVCANGTPEMRRRAAGCLRNLALEGLLREKIMDLGGIEVLLPLTQAEYLLAAEEAVAALWNMSTDAAIARNLVERMKEGDKHPIQHILDTRGSDRELMRLATGLIGQLKKYASSDMKKSTSRTSIGMPEDGDAAPGSSHGIATPPSKSPEVEELEAMKELEAVRISRQNFAVMNIDAPELEGGKKKRPEKNNLLADD